MASGNWVVDNLNSALNTWNGKFEEIWNLVSTSPTDFKSGAVWSVILNINGAVKAIGYALLVLFFVMGVVKTCGSFTELKKPELAFKCFIRFVLAQSAVTWGLDIMMALFNIAQGTVNAIMGASGSGKTTLLNCISTIDTVSAGDILLNGENIAELPDSELARFRREQLGFVFQDFNLLDTLTIEENIGLALTLNHSDPNAVQRQVSSVARKLGC